MDKERTKDGWNGTMEVGKEKKARDELLKSNPRKPSLSTGWDVHDKLQHLSVPLFTVPQNTFLQ